MSRNPRFLVNAAKVSILTNLLGVYIRNYRKVEPKNLRSVVSLLNTDLRSWIGGGSVGRTYCGGLLKLEPRELESLPISSPVIKSARVLVPSLETLFEQGKEAKTHAS